MVTDQKFKYLTNGSFWHQHPFVMHWTSFKMSLIYGFRVLTHHELLKNETSANELWRKGKIAKRLFLTTVPTAVLIGALRGHTRQTETISKCRVTELWIPILLPLSHKALQISLCLGQTLLCPSHCFKPPHCEPCSSSKVYQVVCDEMEDIVQDVTAARRVLPRMWHTGCILAG